MGTLDIFVHELVFRMYFRLVSLFHGSLLDFCKAPFSSQHDFYIHKLELEVLFCSNRCLKLSVPVLQ